MFSKTHRLLSKVHIYLVCTKYTHTQTKYTRTQCHTVMFEMTKEHVNGIFISICMTLTVFIFY